MIVSLSVWPDQPGNGRPKKERGFYAKGARNANFFMDFAPG
jgi:hypothetical protein